MYSRTMRMPSLHRIKSKTILHFACMYDGYDGNGGSGGGSVAYMNCMIMIRSNINGSR